MSVGLLDSHQISYYLEAVRQTAVLVPDTTPPSRKTASALIYLDATGHFHSIVAHADFVRGVAITPERLAKPLCYTYIEHAERRAIYHAAKQGIKTRGASMLLEWYPCADCARAICMAGIERLYCKEPDWTEVRYGFEHARAMLTECGVDVVYL